MPRSWAILRSHVRIVRHDAHFEGARALHHLPADAAQADNAQRLAAQFVAQELLLFPLAGARGGVGLGNVAAPSTSMSAMVCSATETALPPGVFITSTPAAVAASRSTLSTPTPARPMTRSLGAFSSTAGVHLHGAADEQRVRFRQVLAHIPWGWKRSRSNRAGTSTTRSPAAAMGSAIRIFMTVPYDYVVTACGFDGRFGVDRCTAATPVPNSTGYPLALRMISSSGDHREQIGEIEIAQVRDAENLPLHGALAVGDDGAEAVAEFLDDDAGIHARGALTAVTEDPGEAGGEQLQAQLRHGRARGLGQQLRVLDQVRHADLLDVPQRLGQRQNQRGGGRPARFARVAALLFLLQVEVVVRQRGGFGAASRPSG